MCLKHHSKSYTTFCHNLLIKKRLEKYAFFALHKCVTPDNDNNYYYISIFSTFMGLLTHVSVFNKPVF